MSVALTWEDVGAKPRQMLREVQLPLAMPSIMAGVNQTLMLVLSCVVIAGDAVALTELLQLHSDKITSENPVSEFSESYLSPVGGGQAGPPRPVRSNAPQADEGVVESGVEPDVAAALCMKWDPHDRGIARALDEAAGRGIRAYQRQGRLGCCADHRRWNSTVCAPTADHACPTRSVLTSHFPCGAGAVYCQTTCGYC